MTPSHCVTDELRSRLAKLSGELRAQLGTELQVRMGVNTGEVVTSEGGTLATGDAVNVAARLEQAARPGEILISDATRQLARERARARARSAGRREREVRAALRIPAARGAPRCAGFRAALRRAIRRARRLERLGEQGFLSSTVAQLAEALYRQGHYDEAEEAAKSTAELATVDDFDPNYRWRTVLARILARRDEFESAERLAREAVAIVEPTDWHYQRGHAFASLGEVLELARRNDEAREAYERALESFERKEALPEAEEMRARLAALGGATSGAS